MHVIILVFILIFFSLSGVSQNLIKIKLENIPQRTVRRYIVSREIDQLDNFSDIHSSWKHDIDESDFKLNEKLFFLKYNLRDVWKCYRYADPIKAWNGKSIRFGLLISKSTNSVRYCDDTQFTEADTGQVYFLNLKLMLGLLNIPVAFEIINIDLDRLILEFSYIDRNKSLGKQSIYFYDNGDGRTRIVHRTFFKSGSPLRDNLLYPFFHKKFIKEFHRNMEQLVKEEYYPGDKYIDVIGEFVHDPGRNLLDLSLLHH